MFNLWIFVLDVASVWAACFGRGAFEGLPIGDRPVSSSREATGLLGSRVVCMPRGGNGMDCGPPRCRCRVKMGRQRGRATCWRLLCALSVKSPDVMVVDEVGDPSTWLSSSIVQGSPMAVT